MRFMGGKPDWRFLSPAENLSVLTNEMPPDEKQQYEDLGHVFTEAAFQNRRFIIVSPRGKRANKSPRPPTVLGAFRVVGFEATHLVGSKATLIDETTSELLQVTHVPVKLFGHPVFVSVPISQGVRWEARTRGDEPLQWTLIFGICFKQQSAIKWFNQGNIAVVTHNDYEKLFGEPAP